MDIQFKMREDETTATPIKIAEALIHQIPLSTIELEELGTYLTTFARFDRRKRMAERHPEDF